MNIAHWYIGNVCVIQRKISRSHAYTDQRDIERTFFFFFLYNYRKFYRVIYWIGWSITKVPLSQRFVFQYVWDPIQISLFPRIFDWKRGEHGTTEQLKKLKKKFPEKGINNSESAQMN